MGDQIKGVRSTEDVEQNIRPLHWDEKVFELDPNANPFLRITSKIAKKEVTDPHFNWFEDSLLAEWDLITNNAGVGSTLHVDHREYFSSGDLLKIPSTGEMMLVLTAVGSGAGNIVVERGVGTTPVIGINGSGTAVDVFILGNASSEFSGKPEIKSRKKDVVYNYTEIVKTPFGISGTANATTYRTGNDLANQRAKNAIEHSKKLEKISIFGERGYDMLDGKIRRYTAGVLSFINSNVYTAPLLTEAGWDDFLEVLFRKGSSKKIVFCSSGIIKTVNSWVKGHLQTYPKDKTYGVSVYEYICPFGSVGLVNHKEVLTNAYSGYAIGLDMEKVKFRPLKGRGTRLYKNVQERDVDGEVDQYMTEYGIQLVNEECHGLAIIG